MTAHKYEADYCWDTCKQCHEISVSRSHYELDSNETEISVESGLDIYRCDNTKSDHFGHILSDVHQVCNQCDRGL